MVCLCDSRRARCRLEQVSAAMCSRSRRHVLSIISTICVSVQFSRHSVEHFVHYIDCQQQLLRTYHRWVTICADLVERSHWLICATNLQLPEVCLAILTFVVCTIDYRHGLALFQDEYGQRMIAVTHLQSCRHSSSSHYHQAHLRLPLTSFLCAQSSACRGTSGTDMFDIRRHCDLRGAAHTTEAGLLGQR